MRIAFCDDDPAFLAQASSLAKAWANGRIDIVVELFTDGDALIGAHAASTFDVIFLDAVMPMIDGLGVAREIRAADGDVKLVFLTSSPDYAVDSYSVKASNYLLKPVDPTALFRCLDGLEEELRLSARKINVKGAWAMTRVNVASIEYLRANGRRVEVVLADGGVVESIEPLYAFEEKLSLNDGFFKCHRGYIVNINHIGSCLAEEVVMRSGDRIPLSRSYRADFKKAYFAVIFGKEGDRV